MATNTSNEYARLRLAAHLENNLIPQYKLAAELDMDPAILSKILKGERVPTPEQSVRIANVVGIAGTHWGHSRTILKRAAQ